MSTEGRERLAEAVKSRRAELGLAQSDLAASGGPSIVTVGQIERGQIERPQAITLRRIDAALRWEGGTAAAIWHGGAPVVRQQQPAADSPIADIIDAIKRNTALRPEARQHLMNQVELLLLIPRDQDDEQSLREAEVQVTGKAELRAVRESEGDPSTGRRRPPSRR